MEEGKMEVRFGADEILAGTLTVPDEAGPHPAVILIHGGNADERDCGHVGFPVYRLFAEHLQEQGIASLRYDDRGVGGSRGGEKWDCSLAEIADDVRAGVDLLCQQPEIAADRVGLIGWSLGGVLAPMVAAGNDSVAFAVTISGHAVPTADVFLAFRRFLGTQSMVCQDELESALALDQRLFDAVLEGEPIVRLTDELRTRAEVAYANLPDTDQEQLGSFESYLESTWDGALIGLAGKTLFRSMLAHDPLPPLEQLTCPVLALFAEKDEMVSPEINPKLFETALQKAGNPDFSVLVIPEVNHMMTIPRVSTTELAPGVLERISGWICEHVFGVRE
jgi:pimeloyl-ACP methyl ester carboxylesterase